MFICMFSNIMGKLYKIMTKQIAPPCPGKCQQFRTLSGLIIPPYKAPSQLSNLSNWTSSYFPLPYCCLPKVSTSNSDNLLKCMSSVFNCIVFYILLYYHYQALNQYIPVQLYGLIYRYTILNFDTAHRLQYMTRKSANQL